MLCIRSWTHDLAKRQVCITRRYGAFGERVPAPGCAVVTVNLSEAPAPACAPLFLLPVSPRYLLHPAPACAPVILFSVLGKLPFASACFSPIRTILLFPTTAQLRSAVGESNLSGCSKDRTHCCAGCASRQAPLGGKVRTSPGRSDKSSRKTLNSKCDFSHIFEMLSRAGSTDPRASSAGWKPAAILSPEACAHRSSHRQK